MDVPEQAVKETILYQGETEYLVEAGGRIRSRIVVNDLTGRIIWTSKALKKFVGSPVEVLRKWLYKNIDKEYKMVEQMKLEEGYELGSCDMVLILYSSTVL